MENEDGIKNEIRLEGKGSYRIKGVRSRKQAKVILESNQFLRRLKDLGLASVYSPKPGDINIFYIGDVICSGKDGFVFRSPSLYRGDTNKITLPEMYALVDLDRHINKSDLVERTVFEPAQYSSALCNITTGSLTSALYYFITRPLNTPKQADELVRLVFNSEVEIEKRSYLSEYADSNNHPELKKLLTGRQSEKKDREDIEE